MNVGRISRHYHMSSMLPDNRQHFRHGEALADFNACLSAACQTWGKQEMCVRSMGFYLG